MCNFQILFCVSHERNLGFAREVWVKYYAVQPLIGLIHTLALPVFQRGRDRCAWAFVRRAGRPGYCSLLLHIPFYIAMHTLHAGPILDSTSRKIMMIPFPEPVASVVGGGSRAAARSLALVFRLLRQWARCLEWVFEPGSIWGGPRRIWTSCTPTTTTSCVSLRNHMSGSRTRCTLLLSTSGWTWRIRPWRLIGMRNFWISCINTAFLRKSSFMRKSFSSA